MLNRTNLLAACLVAMMGTTAQAQVIYINDSGKESSTTIRETFKSDSQFVPTLKRMPLGSVKLLPGLFSERYELNRQYMLSLDPVKLLQNFYGEAGMRIPGHELVDKTARYDDFYWGWESPSCQLRGHFLGHWLSAAAYIYAETGDATLKQRADFVVEELARCQQKNGGQWAGSIPEKYFDLMANGEALWSPQYTIHKTLMGLYDMATVAGSDQAMDVLSKFCDWFHDWTDRLIRDGKADQAYNGETSGMLEVWANLYGLTHEQKYLDLMERYGNPGVFQLLNRGEDALSSEHSNASIPWSHGSARVYEVTGNDYWRTTTQAFWRNAVDERESFCTGGQGAGEFWVAPGHIADFIGENNQEHCTVYNMIRTADFLYRWTGDEKYADYIERNTYNGILAQQHPESGMVAYFLPMGPGYTKGGEKGWGDPTRDFYCCHGSLVQAHTRYHEVIYYEGDDGISIAQYIPSQLTWKHEGADVTITQDQACNQYGHEFKNNRWNTTIKVKASQTVDFTLSLRLPWWLRSKAVVTVNGEAVAVKNLHGSLNITRRWNDDEVVIKLPTEVYTESLPGSDLKAFMEGPIVLAGLVDHEVELTTKSKSPASVLTPEYGHEYKTVAWTQSHYRTKGQSENFRFVPLYEVGDENYTIYFPMNK